MDREVYVMCIKSDGFYVVRVGDTMESIAERFLGDGLAPLLRQLNGIDDGDLRPGMTILLHPEGLAPERPQKRKTNKSKKEK